MTLKLGITFFLPTFLINFEICRTSPFLKICNYNNLTPNPQYITQRNVWIISKLKIKTSQNFN